MKPRITVLLKTLLTTALIGYLLTRVDLEQLFDVLRSASLFPIFLAFLGTLAAYAVGALRWKKILEAFAIEVRYLRSFQIVLIGSFFNLFLPTLVGGDVLKSIYLAKEKSKPFTLVLTTTFLERAVGYLALLLIGTASAGWSGLKLSGIYLFPWFVAATTAYSGLLWLLLSATVYRLATSWVRRRGWLRLAERVDPIASGMRQLRRDKKVLAGALVLSLGIQLKSVLVTWLIARALHVSAAFHLFLVFVPIISTVTMLPITFSGVGLRETMFYMLFTRVNISEEVAVSIGLLSFLQVVLAALPGGVLYSLYKRDERLGEIMSEVRNA